VKRIRMRSVEDGIVTSIDSHQTCARERDCPFFMQHTAPCAHLFKYAGEAALDLLHPGWIVCDAEVTEPAILYGPSQAPQVPAEDRLRTEAMAIARNVQARLLDLEGDKMVAFGKKFLEMLDRGSVHEPPVVQDPPIIRRPGRPARPQRTLSMMAGLWSRHFFDQNEAW
jgi:hypothetical protein